MVDETKIDDVLAKIEREVNLVEEFRQHVFDISAELKPYRLERNRILSLLRLTYAVVVRLDPEKFYPRDKWHDGNAVVCLGRDWRHIASVRFIGCSRDGHASEYQAVTCKLTTIIGQLERAPLFRELDGLNIHFGRINEALRIAGVDLANAERVLAGLRKEYQRRQKRAK